LHTRSKDPWSFWAIVVIGFGVGLVFLFWACFMAQLKYPSNMRVSSETKV